MRPLTSGWSRFRPEPVRRPLADPPGRAVLHRIERGFSGKPCPSRIGHACVDGVAVQVTYRDVGPERCRRAPQPPSDCAAGPARRPDPRGDRMAPTVGAVRATITRSHRATKMSPSDSRTLIAMNGVMDHHLESPWQQGVELGTLLMNGPDDRTLRSPRAAPCCPPWRPAARARPSTRHARAWASAQHWWSVLPEPERLRRRRLSSPQHRSTLRHATRQSRGPYQPLARDASIRDVIDGVAEEPRESRRVSRFGSCSRQRRFTVLMRVLRAVMSGQDVTRVSESGARPVLRARGERLPAPTRRRQALGRGPAASRGSLPACSQPRSQPSLRPSARPAESSVMRRAFVRTDCR